MKDRPGADHDAWAAARIASSSFGGAVQALRATPLPILMYAGGDDVLPLRGQREFVDTCGAEHFTVPSKNHQTLAREGADVVVPRVTAFLDEVDGDLR